jgi:Galactose oxidase, central domain
MIILTIVITFEQTMKNSKMYSKKLLLALFCCFCELNNGIAQNKWAWMTGYLVSDALWVYPRPVPSPLSIRGVPWLLGASYKPSVREHCAGGIVNNNEIYVYGGAALEDFRASDLWVYDISQQKWAFISDKGWAMNQGQLGVESNSTHPGGRNRMGSAADKDGNIWFFGGLYYNRNSNTEHSLSDLWKYNTKTRKWSYHGQDDYSGNKPLDRYRARMWFDNNNNLWLYGGAIDNSSNTYSYNDLWTYSIQTKIWTHVSGDKNYGWCKTCTNGSYPLTPGTTGSQYYPRARSDYGYWKDSTGNIWIYGGYVESHGSDEYGDLWKFNTLSHEWTLINGSMAFNPPKTLTNPGSRNAPYCWVGNDQKLYFTGGSRRYDQFLRDTWRINTVTSSWELVRDVTTANTTPICAGYRIENSSNLPGASVCTLNHLTTGSHTYLFDGYGMGSNSATGFTGAMWRYSLDGYDSTFTPVAVVDTIVTVRKQNIYCNIILNDSSKSAIVYKSIDIDINTAGRQDSLLTTSGRFLVDTLGVLLFQPKINFVGNVSVGYTFQNDAKYVSNTAQVKITVYSCDSTDIVLDSLTKNINYGYYRYVTNGLSCPEID